MGKIEAAVRKRVRKQNIQRAVLRTVGIVGVLAVAMAAPNTLQLLKYTSFGKRQGRYRVNATIDKLIGRGEITRKFQNGRPSLSLTHKGHLRLTRLTLAEAAKQPRRWDGRWRIVIFDIPEKYRRTRDGLRTDLIGIGFVKLQESVWIYPYDCEDLVALLKTNAKAAKHVLYIVSEHVENDAYLRKQFSLPPER